MRAHWHRAGQYLSDYTSWHVFYDGKPRKSFPQAGTTITDSYRQDVQLVVYTSTYLQPIKYRYCVEEP